jgi:hypothetical protein
MPPRVPCAVPIVLPERERADPVRRAGVTDYRYPHLLAAFKVADPEDIADLLDKRWQSQALRSLTRKLAVSPLDDS